MQSNFCEIKASLRARIAGPRSPRSLAGVRLPCESQVVGPARCGGRTDGKNWPATRSRSIHLEPIHRAGVSRASACVRFHSTPLLEVTMHNARFRLMTAMAGATMCLFATATYAQNTSTTGGTTAGSATTGTTTGTTGSVSNQTGTAPTTLGTQSGAGATGTGTTGTGTNAIDNAAGTGTVGTTTTTDATTAPSDVTTTTTTERRGFPWGLLGLLGLIGLMKRGETTEVRRDTYTTSGARTVGSASDDRMNLQPRAASGTGSSTSGSAGTGSTGSTGGSMGDPNRR